MGGRSKEEKCKSFGEKKSEVEDNVEDPEMDVRLVPVGQLRKPWMSLLRHYEHRCFIRCLAGLYSCQWQRDRQNRIERGQCCCCRRECIFFLLVCLAFCLWFVFLYLWGETKNDYHNFDWYNYGNLGFWFHWSAVFLILAAVVFTYLLLLLIIAVCLISERQRLYLHWSHKIATVLALGFSCFAFAMVTLLWTAQWSIFYLSFQVTAPFLHMVAVFIMVLLAWPVALHFFWTDNKVLQVLIISPYLAILLCLLFIPLGFHSPCIMEKGALGPKPHLIGHRGAPMVAPENTEMSFRKTAAYGAIGFETDVKISLDGVPFLMHDKTLERTTNIEAVNRTWAKALADYFPWSELEKLNSGNWFFEKRPFFEMPPLSPEDEKLARKQRVYKLSDLLKLAYQEDKLVLFDLQYPPAHHPYRDTWIDRTVEVIKNEMGNKSHLVLWLEPNHRSIVESLAPEFQQTSGVAYPVEVLQLSRISRLNLDYRDLRWVDIREYAKANISTNLWVVSEPWLFSLAWCSGADSVTTNAVHTLGNLQRPLFLLTPGEYRSMWIATDVLAVLFILLIFAFHWWREVGHTSYEAQSNGTFDNGPCSTPETELDRMPIVA
uniref:glycerophosphodiester phosphodiesterase domain-containing protein 4 isoform X2 n=1 Tax=Podarcis muralis TaxID=64176 RepID=UPI00109F675C|nr:glycerophosphodiester phosphodiesterase domain-containing protein 4 isoform X2 [Podarcis muralis]